MNKVTYNCTYETFRNYLNSQSQMENKIKPTDSELEILQVLWQKGSSSVRDVNNILNKERNIGYTTTLKLMQIMLDKGLVIRNTDQRSHIYLPAVQEKEIKNNLLDKFLASTFNGSASKLVMQLLGSHTASSEELEEIKELISKIENTAS